MIRTFLSTLSAFHQDRRGSIVLIFAFALVPIILAIGALIDYSLASRTKTALDAYADAAALTAVNQPAMALPLSTVKTNAETIFRAEAGNLKVATLDSVTATVTDSAFKRTAKVDYVATVPTTFMGLASINSVTVAGTATAESALPTYIDFYLLLDNTPSMGVAATPADVTKMVNATKNNKFYEPDCAFACHINNGGKEDPNDYYNLAKNIGITMRIDAVRNASQQLIDKASATQGKNSMYRFAIYTFPAKAEETGLRAITTLTSNLSTAKTLASAIELMTIPYQNYKNDKLTNFGNAFTNINDAITSPGDGSTASTPQKVLFFVSDGVADEENSACLKPMKHANWGSIAPRCQSPINPALCTAIKNRGIKIAVIYTTYLELNDNNWYKDWIKPFNKGPFGPSPNSEIAANMKACASTDLYAEVSPKDSIETALKALFEKALAKARLTR